MIPNLIKPERQTGLCLPHGLLFGHDMPVAHWTWNAFAVEVAPVNAAIGIVRNNKIVGAILFQNFSGHNIEMSYYGPSTLSAGITKSICRYAVERFTTIARMTARTNRKNTKIIRFLSAIGFKLEGVQQRYYGPFGDAVSFVLFREQLERLGGLSQRAEKMK
jgi:RimJ/RimL family protein N-acetyltransferase